MLSRRIRIFLVFAISQTPKYNVCIDLTVHLLSWPHPHPFFKVTGILAVAIQKSGCQVPYFFLIQDNKPQKIKGHPTTGQPFFPKFKVTKI